MKVLVGGKVRVILITVSRLYLHVEHKTTLLSVFPFFFSAAIMNAQRHTKWAAILDLLPFQIGTWNTQNANALVKKLDQDMT